MQLTILNLTSSPLIFTSNLDPEPETLHPSSPLAFATSRWRTLKLTLRNKGAENESFTIKLRSKWLWSAGWESLGSFIPSLPWRIYRLKVSQSHHRLVIIPRRNLSSFLLDMPDSVPLSCLLLPGTHETVAFYGWPFAQCQFPTSSLPVQLALGCRVFDVRLSVEGNELMAYHGSIAQRSSFSSILSAIQIFLSSAAGRSETIVLSIMEEGSMRPTSPIFSELMHNAVMANRKLWYLENRIPTLGEVRGKIVLFSRFGRDGTGWEGGLEGLGIHPTHWPDSQREGFEWNLRGGKVRVHDWYGIPSLLSIPEKARLASAFLLPPSDGNNVPPTLSITYLSAASIPLALPSPTACGIGFPELRLGIEGINSRVGRWVLNLLAGDSPIPGEIADDWSLLGEDDDDDSVPREKDETRLRGWALMDFCEYGGENGRGEGIMPLLIECNFRGRRRGEEGWE